MYRLICHVILQRNSTAVSIPFTRVKRNRSLANKVWAFDQPRDCAVMTTRQVRNGTESIFLVTHDTNNNAWQFFGQTDANLTDVRVVALREIVALDATVLKIANLPSGWKATRANLDAPWERSANLVSR
jgi:hypothetical protein